MFLKSEVNKRIEVCNDTILFFRSFFETVLNENRKSLSDTIFKRAKYVIEENARVLKAVHNLENGDIKSLGELLYETHYGLKNDYEVSCQELDFLVSFTENIPEVAGARMMGGGFGGCAINIVHKDKVEELIENVSAAYEEKHNIKLSSIITTISDGVKRI